MPAVSKQLVREFRSTRHVWLIFICYFFITLKLGLFDKTFISADAAQNFIEFILGIGNKLIAEPLFDFIKRKCSY